MFFKASELGLIKIADDARTNLCRLTNDSILICLNKHKKSTLGQKAIAINTRKVHLSHMHLNILTVINAKSGSLT